MQCGDLDRNPALDVRPPRQDKILPVYLDVDEVARAMSLPSPNTVLGLRDRAILELFYSAGIRLRELAGLKIEAVDLADKLVRVVGKGNKERLVPFGEPARVALVAYLMRRGELISEQTVDQTALVFGALWASAESEWYSRSRCPVSQQSDWAVFVSPCIAPRLCNPSAGCGCRSQCGERIARPCESFYYAGLYACEC